MAGWWLESRSLITRQEDIYHGVSQVILLNIVRQHQQIIIESWILGPRTGRTRNSRNWAGMATEQQPTITLTTRFNDNTTNLGWSGW